MACILLKLGQKLYETDSLRSVSLTLPPLWEQLRDSRQPELGAVVWIWVELSFCVTLPDNWEISRNKLTGVLLLLLLLLPQTNSQSHHRGAACPVRAAPHTHSRNSSERVFLQSL